MIECSLGPALSERGFHSRSRNFPTANYTQLARGVFRNGELLGYLVIRKIGSEFRISAVEISSKGLEDFFSQQSADELGTFFFSRQFLEAVGTHIRFRSWGGGEADI